MKSAFGLPMEPEADDNGSRFNKSSSKHNGTYFGTYTWAKDIGISNGKLLENITEGNTSVDTSMSAVAFKNLSD